MLDFNLSGRNYFDALPQPVLVYGTTIEYCNDAARDVLEQLGADVEVGAPAPELLPPAEQCPCVVTLTGGVWQAALRPLEGLALCQLSRLSNARELPEQIRMLAQGLRRQLSNTGLSLEYLQNNLSELEQQRSRESIATLNRSFLQLLRLMDHLDLYTRTPEELTAISPPRPVELHDFCVWLHLEVEPLVRQLGRSFALDLAPGPLYVQVNRNLLYRICCNLISNALHAGGDLHLKLRPNRSHTEAVLTLSDNAGGIDPNRLSTLFLPENQTEQGGLALGLPLSARLSQLYPGASLLFAAKEHGSSVSLSLPLYLDEGGRPLSELREDPEAQRPGVESGFSLLLTELSDVLPGSMYTQDDVF